MTNLHDRPGIKWGICTQTISFSGCSQGPCTQTSSVGAESKLKFEKRMGKATLPSPRHTNLLLGVLALRLEGGRDDDLCEAELCLFGLCWAQPVLTEGSACRGFTNSVYQRNTKNIKADLVSTICSVTAVTLQGPPLSACSKHFFYLGCNRICTCPALWR